MFVWFHGSATEPPVLLEFRSSKTFILVTVTTAIFTDIFLYGIVVPVLPFSLTTRVAIDPEHVQTWISIFLAVFGAALLLAAPVFGWLSDRFSSRRGSFLAGLLALAGATTMLCVGNSIAVLAAGRTLQGISAAVVWVVGLALIVDTVGPDAVGVMMGYVGLSMSLAFLLAPLLGGVIFAKAGYYSVFAMAFGLIGLDVCLRLAMIEKKMAKRWTQVEASPEAENAVSDAGRAQQKIDDPIELSNQPTFPEEDQIRSVQEPNCDAASPTISTDKFPETAAEAHAPENVPSLFKRFIQHLPPFIFLLSSRRVLSALWASIMQASLLTAFDSILPLFVRDTFHWNSIGAGLIFLPMVLASAVGPVIGWASDKYGPRWFTTAGFVFACPFLILLRLIDHDTLDLKILLCALLAMVGVGLTLALTPLIAEIAYAVDAKAKRHPPGFFGKNGAYAQAYSLFNMAWAAGCLIGPLLGGLINQSHGWGTTTLILGCVSGVTAIPVVIWTGGSIFKKARKRRREGEQSEVSGKV